MCTAAISPSWTRRLLTVCCGLLWLGTPLAPLRAEESPGALVRQEVANVLAVLKNEQLDAGERHARLREILIEKFDLEDMSQRILAANWKSVSDRDRARFIELFQQVLEKTYLSAIESYTTEQVNVGGERRKGDKAAVIVTVVRPDGTDIPLLFKLKRTPGGWLAYDTNIEGIGMVSHYRKSYGEFIKNRGVEGLLRHMQEGLERSRGSSG